MKVLRSNVQMWGASSPVRSPPTFPLPHMSCKVRDEARKLGDEAKKVTPSIKIKIKITNQKSNPNKK